MRLRNVKDAFERLDSFDAVIQNPEQYKGRWCEFFGNDNPIYIEIGMGRGGFLISHALNNPNINYIGFEKFTVVIVKALENIEKEENPLDNLCVVRFDAQQILELFEDDEVDRIYLNFSDPWPKDRHAKRRLTCRDFLHRYKQVLKTEGNITFKTDNDDLFDYSIEEMKAVGMDFEKMTLDLHKSEFIEGNIMTSYEKKFHEMGKNINMVQAVFAE